MGKRFLTDLQFEHIFNGAKKSSYVDVEKGCLVVPLHDLKDVLYRHCISRMKMSDTERGKAISKAHRWRLDNATAEERKAVAAHLDQYHYDAAVRQKSAETFVANNHRGARNWCSKPVRCITTDQCFSCIREAAELLDIPYTGICSVLHHRQQRTHNLEFSFISREEYLDAVGANSAAVPPTNKGGDTNGE